MLLRMFSATMQINPTTELYLTCYWDERTHPSEPNNSQFKPIGPIEFFGRQKMPLVINEALDRWRKIAQLAGDRFSLEGMLKALILDDELGCVRISVADNHGNGSEIYHPTKWLMFLGASGPQV